MGGHPLQLRSRHRRKLDALRGPFRFAYARDRQGQARRVQLREHLERSTGQGGSQSGYVGVRDSNIGQLHLTDAEKHRLLDFLGALDGEPPAAELLSPPKLPD